MKEKMGEIREKKRGMIRRGEKIRKEEEIR